MSYLYSYASTFAQEIIDYIDSLKTEGLSLSYTRVSQSALRHLDRFLVKINLTHKSLTTETISNWHDSIKLSSDVQSNYVHSVNRFLKHLHKIGVYKIDKIPRRGLYRYTSIFAKEIEEYLQLMSEIGSHTNHRQSVLRNLDKYLTDNELFEKTLTMQVLVKWYDYRTVKDVSKRLDISIINEFSRYLSSVGIIAECFDISALGITNKPVPYEFASVFAAEIVKYLQYYSAIGRKVHVHRSALRSFDRYLVSDNYNQRILTDDIALKWLKSLDISRATKSNYLKAIKGLAEYLISIDIPANYPEQPIQHKYYVSYVFSSEEISKIFEAADNFKGCSYMTRTAFVFPILLRILYGCGLRVDECCSLKWADVNVDEGVITLYKAKNEIQRYVPMDSSLIETLKIYKSVLIRQKLFGTYLFESNKYPGNYFKQNTFYQWFQNVLDAAGIVYTAKPHERKEVYALIV